MRNWTFWDWAGYGALAIAAVVTAADAALRNAPTVANKMPTLLANEWWAFVPLVLVIIGTIVLVARAFGILGKDSGQRNVVTPEWAPFPPNWNDPLTEVLRQKYENEEVSLDGKRFVECKFSNVRYHYNGRAPFEMLACDHAGTGSPIIGTGNPGMHSLIRLMHTLKMIPGELKYDVRRVGTPR